MRRVRIPYFRIWYSTTYTTLFALTVVLLAATPGDLIYQSIRNDYLPSIFIIGGVTLVTALLALLVYSTRLYTNRSVLAAIPKNFLPIDHGEVGRTVRRLIVREWHRSALVAWDSRPRDTRNELSNDEDDSRPGTAERVQRATRRRSHIHNATVIPINPKSPPWGPIGHAGWSSPASDDIPDLQFSTVILELPNLIEAKAVSLAPPDPTVGGGLPTPDARVVALLQRLPGMGMREYLAQLGSLGLINPPALGPRFIQQYEYARFSTIALTETQFRQLMALFADILAGMTELDADLVLDVLEADGTFDSSDSASFAASMSPSQSSSNDTGSVRRYQTPGPSSAGVRSPSMMTAATAPSRTSRLLHPGDRARTVSEQSRRSAESFSRTRADLDDNDGDDESSLSSAMGSLQSAESVVRHHPTAAG